MNKPMMKLTALAVMATLGVTGCFKDDTPPAGGKTDYVTSGIITGFGSVYVNGVKFETDSTQYDIDDAAGTEDQLKVGMFVTLQGNVNADGTTGSAATISFESDVEGIVISNDGAGTLNVMGQTVTTDVNTKFESHVAGVTMIEEILPDSIVEVSGYSNGNGSIYATRVEVKAASHVAGDEMEVKGVVSQLSAYTFVIGGMTIDHTTAQLEDFNGIALADGQYVEVKSTEGLSGGNLVASKIELENEDGKDEKREDGKEMEISGVVTGNVNVDGNMVEINGQQVTLNSETEYDNGSLAELVVGTMVTVEGEFNANGEFVAEEIEFGRDADVEMKGLVDKVDAAAGTITVFGQTYHVDNSTMMVDERDDNGLTPEKYFSLANITAGEWVEVEGYYDEAGKLITIEVERDDPEMSEAGAYAMELEGKIQAIATSGELTVAGVTVDASANSGIQYAVDMKLKMIGSYSANVFTATLVEVDN